MRLKLFLLILSSLLFLSSCKIYFTQDLRKQVEAQKIDINNIQYYTSRKIILQRIDNTNTVTKDTTKLKQTQETVIERIKIKRNTPGICVSATPTEMQMKFEDKENCELRFILTDTTVQSGLYKLGALEWDDKVGKIPYDGKIFYTQPPLFFFQAHSHEASLKVKRKFLRRWKIKYRKVKGLKLDKK